MKNKIAMKTHTTTLEDFFSESYLQYYHTIRRYIASRIYFGYEADDLVQDVFVRLWEHKEFLNRDTVCSLLFTIARNLITDKVRRYYKKEDFVSYMYKVGETSRNTTEEIVSSRELDTLHRHVISMLPDKRRKIYELSFYNEHSSQAIAGQLSISHRTVEGQLLLARKAVRSYVNKHYQKVS